ncbi:hypothetical protein X953_01040 [Virgibacillus sp. SK37]|nr:hypothetical protein X953_01040 [Virgibacillus sp. SK37]
MNRIILSFDQQRNLLVFFWVEFPGLLNIYKIDRILANIAIKWRVIQVSGHRKGWTG